MFLIILKQIIISIMAISLVNAAPLYIYADHNLLTAYENDMFLCNSSYETNYFTSAATETYFVCYVKDELYGNSFL